MSAASKRTESDSLKAAAVMRLNFERQGGHGGAFAALYEGVLRDYGLRDEEVLAYLETHREALEAALAGER